MSALSAAIQQREALLERAARRGYVPLGGGRRLYGWAARAAVESDFPIYVTRVVDAPTRHIKIRRRRR